MYICTYPCRNVRSNWWSRLWSRFSAFLIFFWRKYFKNHKIDPCYITFRYFYLFFLYYCLFQNSSALLMLLFIHIMDQGRQMVCFQTKITKLGIFWRVLQCWYILWPFRLFYGLLVYFVDIWWILRLFGIFPPFWYVVPRKIWQPCNGPTSYARLNLCFSDEIMDKMPTNWKWKEMLINR
jgi:hypothetical protein